MRKQSYYMVIPASVWESNLDEKSILLYGHIATLANKSGYAYANNGYFEKVLKISTTTLGRKLNQLEQAGVIKRKLIYDTDNKTVKERRIYLNTAISTDEHRAIVTGEHRAIDTGEQDNNTSNNNTSINNIDDVLGKIFFKLVDMYPKNRVGNRQHGLKKFKELDIEQAKLALKNLNRYLDVANGYVKSLQNYITEECWSEAWLKAEEETKRNKAHKTIKQDTKTFQSNYGDV